MIHTLIHAVWGNWVRSYSLTLLVYLFTFRHRRQWASKCDQAGDVHGRLRSVSDWNLTQLHSERVARRHQEGSLRHWKLSAPALLCSRPVGRIKPISQLRFDYNTTTIRRCHDAFDKDGSDRNYDMCSIRLRYDYDTTTTKNLHVHFELEAGAHDTS